MNNQLLIDNLRCIPDWPIKGVNFRDVTTLFKNPDCVKEITDELYEMYKDKGITKIVGIESRGFVMSSALAVRLGAGIVLCRKPGKLPCETVQQSYAKEYGIDTIEIHKDAIEEGDIVLLHDDLLATGGTMKAACDLVKKFKPKKVYANFIIEHRHLDTHPDLRNLICGNAQLCVPTNIHATFHVKQKQSRTAHSKPLT